MDQKHHTTNSEDARTQRLYFLCKVHKLLTNSIQSFPVAAAHETQIVNRLLRNYLDRVPSLVNDLTEVFKDGVDGIFGKPSQCLGNYGDAVNPGFMAC